MLDTHNVKHRYIHQRLHFQSPSDTVTTLCLQLREDLNQKNTWSKFLNCNACIQSCLPANDEVRHGDQEGSKRHQDTSNCYDLGSVEFGTKIAHKGNHQQIPYRVEMIRRGDADESKALNMRPALEKISNIVFCKGCIQCLYA